jgi:hypothetical protein
MHDDATTAELWALPNLGIGTAFERSHLRTVGSRFTNLGGDFIASEVSATMIDWMFCHEW